MVATARLVVQMSPEEKRALDGRARRAGISTAEFVRRRVGPDEFETHRDEIVALLTALERASPAILAALDEALVTASNMAASLDKPVGSR